MFGIRRKSHGHGLQILDHQIKLAAVSGSSYRIQLQAAHSAPLPEGIIRDGRIIEEEQLVHALRGLCKQLKLDGQPVTLTIPTSSIVLRRSVFASLKDNELRNLIDVELHGGGAQLPFRDPVFDYARIGKVGQDDDVIIFASPSEVIDNYVRVVRRSGLQPIAVDLAPLALLRVLCKYVKAKGYNVPGCIMILSAESELVELSIYKDGYPVFFRSIPVQTHTMIDEDTDYLEAYGQHFSVELGRVMNYYKYTVATNSDDAIESVYLVGEEHFAQGLAGVMKDWFPGSIRIVEMNDLLHAQGDDLLSYAVPIGLAMKGA